MFCSLICSLCSVFGTFVRCENSKTSFDFRSLIRTFTINRLGTFVRCENSKQVLIFAHLFVPLQAILTYII